MYKMIQKRYDFSWEIVDPILYSHAAERIGVPRWIGANCQTWELSRY
jgi:hypothetical protein